MFIHSVINGRLLYSSFSASIHNFQFFESDLLQVNNLNEEKDAGRDDKETS